MDKELNKVYYINILEEDMQYAYDFLVGNRKYSIVTPLDLNLKSNGIDSLMVLIHGSENGGVEYYYNEIVSIEELGTIIIPNLKNKYPKLKEIGVVCCYGNKQQIGVTVDGVKIFPLIRSDFESDLALVTDYDGSHPQLIISTVETVDIIKNRIIEMSNKY